MAKKTAAKRVSPSTKSPALRELPILNVSGSGCEKVWSGKIGRLRIYDQPGSTGKKVFAYIDPGRNSDYVGWSDDPNMIKALFLTRDNGRSIQGYTNPQCKIEWIDY